MESSLVPDLLRLAAVGLLVLANAFFVAAEFSLVSVRRTRIAELVDQGNFSAKAVQTAMQNPDRVIAATQLGITLASLGLGWLGEPALAHLLEPVIALFPRAVQSGISHSLSAVIAFIIITFLHVVIGELTPKSIALQNPERTSLFVARPTMWTEWIFKPIIWVMNGAGNALLRLMGIKPASGLELVHSVEELRMLVTASTEGGAVEADESEMLHAVFDFGELIVRQVMIPRTEIVATEAGATLQEVIALVGQSTFTKFPVYEENLDQIIGVVYIKDLLCVLEDSEAEKRTARDLMRPAIYVPETIPVNALLRQFRHSRQHIAIALDEYGGTAGLVTLEDLLEEIVGEVQDPFDTTAPEIQIRPDGSAIIQGLTLIEVVNEELNLDLQDPYSETIAGYVLGKLGRIPHEGDAVDGHGVRLRVEAMDGLRIARLSLARMDHPAETSQSSTSPARD